MSVLQAQVFQEDFQQERKDREKAHSQVAEIEQRYQHQLHSLVEQLDRTTQELEHTKNDLARRKDTAAEAFLPSHIDQLSERLSTRDHEVNQHKKDVGALKHQLDIQRQRVNGISVFVELISMYRLYPTPDNHQPSQSFICTIISRKYAHGQ